MTMFLRFLTVVLALALCALAACGGGSGGGNVAGSTPGPITPPRDNPDGSWLTFDPATPEIVAYEGESQRFAITATSSKIFSQNFNIGVIDTTGVISTDISLTTVNQLSYRANLQTAPGLTAGLHLASLEVRICEDDPHTCSKPFPGSPWHVPLKVDVKSKAEGASRLTLSGGPLQADTYPGEQISLKFNGTMSADLAQSFLTIVIADPSGLTASNNVEIQSFSQEFSVGVTTAANLAQGEHSGNLEVRLCLDGSSCRQQASGSPWLMPLKVTVRPPSTLTTLQPLPSASAWSSFNGNATHTGYVAGTFDPAKFTRRWIQSSASLSPQGNGMASDNGKVFYVRNYGNTLAELIAVNESTGEIAWRANLGENAGAPAVANGRVYVASNNRLSTPGPGYLWVFNQQTGALVNKLAMDGPGGYLAPAVVGSDLYLGSGNNTGMSKYLGATDMLAWDSGQLTMDRTWTPAVDANFAYAFVDGKFVAVSASTGAISWQVDVPNYAPRGGSSAPATVSGSRAYVLSDSRLMAFDLTAHSLVWTQFGFDGGSAALANGTLYVATNSLLMVHSANTGESLWGIGLSGAFGTAGFKNVIVTDNLAFVSSYSTLLAIDLKTHKVVWSSPFGGGLAISNNGVLYSLNDEGKLVAINLR